MIDSASLHCPACVGVAGTRTRTGTGTVGCPSNPCPEGLKVSFVRLLSSRVKDVALIGEKL